MNIYKIKINEHENNEYYELTEEDFFPPQDDRICNFVSYFNEDCEGYLEYIEWFWDFYGNDIYDDCDEYIENNCEYKFCEYIF